MTTPEASIKITATDLTDKAFKSANQSLVKFTAQAAKVTAAFASVGGVVLFKNIIENTAQSEKVLAQLDARLRSTGGAAGFTRDQLIDMSKGLQSISTFGDEAIQEMQTLLLQFNNLKGPQFQAAQESILNISTALGMDLSSAAMQVGKALQEPVEGLSALSRMGVQFTDSQEDVIKKLVETGRTAEAQKLILQELEEKFGGAARAARNTFGGSLTALREAAGDLLEADSLGGTQAAIDQLTKTLQDPRTVEAAQKLTTALITGFSKAVEVLAEIPNFMEFLGESTAKFINGSADPIERIDEKIAGISGEIARLGNVIKAHGPGGFVPPQVTEEFDQLSEQLSRLRKEREMLVRDVNNSPSAQGHGDDGSKKSAPSVVGIIGKSQPTATGVTDETVQKELELIQRSLMTKEQLLVADHEKQIAFIDKNVSDQEARHRLVEQLTDRHQKELSKIHLHGLNTRERFERMSSANKVRSLISDGVQMTQGVASNNKKMFELNKKLALADAMVNLPDAVIKSFNNAGGYPWGLIPAGLMLATGLARIAEIRSATFEAGGTAPSLLGQGGGGSTVNTVPIVPPVPDPAEQQGQREPERVVQIIIGGPVDRQYLREALLPALRDEIDESDATFISANSAQAREIRRGSS